MQQVSGQIDGSPEDGQKNVSVSGQRRLHSPVQHLCETTPGKLCIGLGTL